MEASIVLVSDTQVHKFHLNLYLSFLVRMTKDSSRVSTGCWWGIFYLVILLSLVITCEIIFKHTESKKCILFIVCGYISGRLGGNYGIMEIEGEISKLIDRGKFILLLSENEKIKNVPGINKFRRKVKKELLFLEEVM